MQNHQTDISAILGSLGFSRKEMAVYMAILELGRGTVTQLARKAGINRTTGYDILDTLTHQGLVRESGKRPKQEYVAESPDNLIRILRKKRDETDEQLRVAEEFVPRLKSLHKVGSRPQVKFYEGIEGLKEVYEDTLTSTEPIVAYAAYEDMHATLKDYFPSYYRRRAEKGIFARGIVPRTPGAVERAKLNEEEMRDMVIVPKEKFDISPDIEIYDNKVMIASWRDRLGIIIESAEVAQAMKQIFELAWMEAKRLEKQSGEAKPNIRQH